MWSQRLEELARLAGRDASEVYEAWVERAAIREFEGGQDRAGAERDAFTDVESELCSSLPRRGPRSTPSIAESDAVDVDARRWR